MEIRVLTLPSRLLLAHHGNMPSYTYDARGNVTNNSKLGFTYDYANQPTAITGGAANGSYTYDSKKKRVKQVVGGKTIYSVYGASGALIHRDDATSNVKTDYISAAGKTIARIKGTVSYMHQDHLGSVVASTTSTGAIAWREDYTPYGEKRVDPNKPDNIVYNSDISDELHKDGFWKKGKFDELLE